MEYLYDGSFDGLLTCIYYHYYYETATGIYQQEYFQPTLLSSMAVVTDPTYAQRVYQAIENKISADALIKVYHVYLTSSPDKENLILDYLRLGFKMGANVDLYHSHSAVYPVHKLDKKVTTEVHRFLGLLRFKDTGNFLYAALSPDHHILTLIADHFADRLAGERWVIHDQKRNLAIVYDGKGYSKEDLPIQCKWYLTEFSYHMHEDVPQEELHWQLLWQHYFQRISIESRCNPRLQSQFVPHRYRRHLLEFQISPQSQ